MPKMKTRRGAAKRFTVTGSGKIKRGKAYKRHQLSCKTRKEKRNLRHATTVAEVDSRNVRRLIPYL
jgi:large subunit ribosomal protein L35